MSLLKVALERQRFDLAAHALVYGFIKVQKDEKKGRRQVKKAGFLQPRAR